MSLGRSLRFSTRLSSSLGSCHALACPSCSFPIHKFSPQLQQAQPLQPPCRQISPPLRMTFHTSSQRLAQPPSADSLMENLNDLYGTARDEFEIAMEETQSNTVYAADDREAAVEAFAALKEAYEQAIREADPETGAEVQSRVGQRIRELEAAIENMNKLAMESD